MNFNTEMTPINSEFEVFNRSGYEYLLGYSAVQSVYEIDV
jgi:hypothetical protein